MSLNAGKEERLGIVISAISAVIALLLFFWLRNGDRTERKPQLETGSQPFIIQNK